MKHIKTLAAGSVLGLAIGGFALAQTHHPAAGQHGANGAAMAEHLPHIFAHMASFDANKDGQLDATERKSLADAIAQVYARLAPFDANHDGVLDATEMAAIKSAVEKGQLECPQGAFGANSAAHQ